MDEQLPPRIRYRIDGEPSDLCISASELPGKRGRAAVNRYAQHWPDLIHTARYLTSPDGPVGCLSKGGSLNKRLNRVHREATIHVTGATVLRCERNDEWCGPRYMGHETHHHHVLPTCDIEEPLQE